jgi:hypothetical protein
VADPLKEDDWRIRLNIYQTFVDRGHPPSFGETAVALGFAPDNVRQAYHRLHRAHAIFLEPRTDNVRMANPLSAVPTPYQVRVNGKSLYANCAWDSLGIPAMLHADAQIEARVNDVSEPIRYAIEQGALQADDKLVIHFPLPFRDWYDNLVHT